MTPAMHTTGADQPLGPLLIGLAGTDVSPEESTWLRHPAVGGVVLFTRNYRDLSQLIGAHRCQLRRSPVGIC